MKKINAILALSAIALSMVSCSSDKDEAIVPQEGEKVHVSFEVSVKKPDATRADLNVTGNGYASMIWITGDEIGVSSDEYDHVDPIYVRVDPESTNTQRATAEGMVNSTSGGYLCIYPKVAFLSKVDKNSAIISIPNYQDISEGFQICQSAFLQVGYTKKSSNFINMETPCSFLVFNTGDHSDIKEVDVTAYDKENNPYSIAGAISVKKTGTSGFDQVAGNTIGDNPVYNKISCLYHYGSFFPKRHNFAIAIRPGRPDKLVIEVMYEDANANCTTKTYTTTKMDDDQELEFDRGVYHQFPTF